MSLNGDPDMPETPNPGHPERGQGTDDIRYDVESMEAAYTCWGQGVPHVLDEEYLAIWEGSKPGLSRHDVQTRLTKQRQILDAIRAGQQIREIRGAVAYGNTAEMVEGNLLRAIAMFEEAVRCQGRNLTVNQTRVLSARQQ